MQAKIDHLHQLITNYQKLAITFSGGIDSTVLLHQAKKVLGIENVLAIVVNSELFQDKEYERAIKIAESFQVQVIGTEIEELAEPEIANNTPDSWYRSKQLLYGEVKQIAQTKGFLHVADGMIMNDLSDYRPGLRARDEAGILSPLQEAGFYKPEIRELAQQVGIPIWNKPASCSVVSRFPYYHSITLEKVERVIQAENFLQQMGFLINRVRCHDDLARIEIEECQLGEIFQQKSVIDSYFKKIGFAYISIDLMGYKMGRMNEVLLNDKIKV